MLECANTENCRQAKIIAVGSKNIVFDKTAIILHMLEDPGMCLNGFTVQESEKLLFLGVLNLESQILSFKVFLDLRNFPGILNPRFFGKQNENSRVVPILSVFAKILRKAP